MFDDSPRIAFLLPCLEGGGAERVSAILANSLANAGAQVEVVTPDPDGPMQKVIAGNVEIKKLPNDGSLLTFLGLARYLQGFGRGVMFSAGRRMDFMALIARQLVRSGPRIVPVIHADCSHSRGWQSLLGSPTLRFVFRQAYLSADRIVAVSHGAAEAFADSFQIPQERVQTIYNPAVADDLPLHAAVPVDHPWFAKGEPPVLISVGRLAEAKDLGTLLSAFAIVRAQRECRLVILGEGPQLARLQTLAKALGIAKAVDFAGFVPNPYGYMARASLFVLSSRWEGLPTVVVEALALGVPIVSTDCPSGPNEILEGGKWGRLVPVGNPEAMASSIHKALSEPRPGYGKEVVERFTAARAQRHYAHVIRQVLCG